MHESPHCTSYSYADILYIQHAYVELKAQVVYRLHREMIDMKPQELSLKSI